MKRKLAKRKAAGSSVRQPVPLCVLSDSHTGQILLKGDNISLIQQVQQ
jgi:hypothetical protein